MSIDRENIFGLEIDSDALVPLEGKYRYKWVEEAFEFERATGKQVAMEYSSSYMGKTFGRRQTQWILFFALGVLAFFALRIGYLQFFGGDNYLALAEMNRQRYIPIPSERGLIFDRNLYQLTKNVPRFSLVAVPQDLPRGHEEFQRVIRQVSLLTGVPEGDITTLLEKYRGYTYESIAIVDDLDYESALRAQIEAATLPGIRIETGSKRLYELTVEPGLTDKLGLVSSTLPMTFSHILGYQGKISPDELGDARSSNGLYSEGYLPNDLIGKTGIEQSAETTLRGKYGKKLIEVDAVGKQQVLLSEDSPEPGRHVVLTIDMPIQAKLEELLAVAMAENEKLRGSAVALDPRNGEVLAMVSLPTYDNNDFSGGISIENYEKYITNPSKPLFNRIVSGVYPSGSVIKPAIAAGALNEGVVTKNTTFLSTGGLQVNAWFFPDWRAGGHGRVDVYDAIADSVNTYFYYIGGGYKDFVGMGVETIARYLSEFGLARQTGIELSGEAKGHIPYPEWKEEVKGERWYVGDTYNLSIGQGDLLVTPLQMAYVTSLISRPGTAFRPHIIQAYLDPQSLEESYPELEHPQKPDVAMAHLQTVREAMRRCVTVGSCRYLSSLPIEVAGKTGTAQWNSNKENHAWFVTFAPYKDPQIVLVIQIEEGGGGSEIPPRIAHKFYTWWAQYKGI
ncbi:penicillin-binding protein 2 [Candidatus Nomurabacteria bacterium]|nr:penicillin-binding protein 2 [Candidatus Nomurabacteria bacterium]